MRNGKARTQKGIRGMNLAAELLTSLGFPAERARGMRDLYCPALSEWVHIEVKNVRMRLGDSKWDDAVQQAKDDAFKRGVSWVLLWLCVRGCWALTSRDAHGHVSTATLPRAMADRLNWLKNTTMAMADAAVPLSQPVREGVSQ